MFLQNESRILLTPSPGTLADAPSVLASRDPAEGWLASADVGLTRTKAPCSVNTRHGDRESPKEHDIVLAEGLHQRGVDRRFFLRVTDVRWTGNWGIAVCILVSPGN